MTHTSPIDIFDRIRSFAFFLLAVTYYLIAERIAASAAEGLASGDWTELVYRSMLVFLLLVGYAAMGFAFQRQRSPLKAMGFVPRSTAREEFAVGSALGWGMIIACVLPIALVGGLRITLWTTPRQIGLAVLDLVVLALAALLEEVAFRGYPFQRLIEAIGPLMATLLMSVLFALRHLGNPDSTAAGVVVTVFAGWLLSAAYLRTRALWLPWGFHFSWNVAMGLLFGLPISGIRTFSPIIESNTTGPFWLTGGGYGPEGSLICALVLLAGLVVLFKVTGEYAYRYTLPVIVPAGIPVDLDAAARRQHEAAMAVPGEALPAAPAGSTLVQIAPAAPSFLPTNGREAQDVREESAEERTTGPNLP